MSPTFRDLKWPNKCRLALALFFSVGQRVFSGASNRGLLEERTLHVFSTDYRDVFSKTVTVFLDQYAAMLILVASISSKIWEVAG
jgi:hypothetical protein